MANTLRFKRGLVSGIPTAALGEPLFTTDTFDLYIGNGTGNTRFQKYIASGTTGQLLRGDGSLLTMPIVLTSPSNGQVLKYDGTNWVNSADAGVTGSGTAGQVTYWGSSSTITGSNNLFWNAANNRLGINTNAPSYTADIRSAAGTVLSLSGGSSTNQGAALYITNSAFTSTLTAFGDSANILGGTPDASATIFTGSSIPLHFYINGGQAARISTSRNFIINNASTDNGLRFQVTGDGYFSGSVGIGTTTLTGYTLAVGKNITGSTNAQAIRSVGVIQSDVTSKAYYYTAQSFTANANFALPDLYLYAAFGGTLSNITAGGSITNQYGYFVDASLTGATNNYGFYGNIPSGTGRWNLYMNGTASNYLAGNLGIGITTPAGNLDVYNATSSSIYNRVGAAGANWVTTSTQSQIGTYSNIPLQIKTNDTARIYITNGGNVLVGTITDAGFKLDVNGTMRVSGASTFSSTISAAGQITGASGATEGKFNFLGYNGAYGGILSNTGLSSSYNAVYLYSNFNAARNGQGNSALPSYILELGGATPNNDSFSIQRSAAGSFTFSNLFKVDGTGAATFSSSVTATSYNATTQNIFSVGGTEGMRLTATNRNLHIGTFSSDSGEKLQVVGTAKIGTYSTTGYSLVVQNNGANDVSGIRISTGATVDGYLSLAYDATNTYGSIQAGDNNVFRNIIINRQGGSVGIGANPNNSAVLQADSTTRGFLPPRMTTTQRNAIPTPAAGLIVYDTTDNKHYGYNGTTWNAFY